MAPIANLLKIFRQNIEKSKDHPPLEAREKCADAARQIIKTSIIATKKTVKNAAALIGNNKTIFTHSYSSTVLQTFTHLSRQNLKVIITEARPLCEGYKLAEKLSELQIPTTLITDAQAGLFVRKADMVLVGADSILSDFSTVNKAGTYLIALSAYDNNIPFYVCCEKYKQILPNSEQPELEIMNPAELKAPVLPYVSVENIYFEITPAKFITGWINEDGVFRIQPH
jgi:translation initiation factor eIF-2B subunit delta